MSKGVKTYWTCRFTFNERQDYGACVKRTQDGIRRANDFI